MDFSFYDGTRSEDKTMWTLYVVYFMFISYNPIEISINPNRIVD